MHYYRMLFKMKKKTINEHKKRLQFHMSTTLDTLYMHQYTVAKRNCKLYYLILYKTKKIGSRLPIG